MAGSDPGMYRVARTTTIAAAPEAVYEWLVDFHRWREWSPWEEVDPDLQRTYGGADAGVGATYEWSGNRKAGAGRMEITEATPPHELQLRLDFLKPFKSSNTQRFVLRSEGGATRITWAMVGAKTLATRVMGVFTSMDKLVGPDFDRGLAKLKAIAES